MEHLLPFAESRSTTRTAVLSATIALGCAVLLRVAIDALQRRRRRAHKSKVQLQPAPRANEVKIDHAEGDLLAQPSVDQLQQDKELYHRLHNVHAYPDALPAAHARLLSLLDETVASSARLPAGSIQEAVPEYSRERLESFLSASHDATSERYSAYIDRRKAGGAREMFADRKTALWWLKNSAPVKYVDGTWIAHVHKITERFRERPASAIAWQVMSEELGDGTLAKNHVYVYEELMRSLGIALPPAYERAFISPSLNLEEARCWKAALAQLSISTFPDHFLPEALGFNMAYETMPLHLLVSVHELRELKLDPYYFVLHIAIDNSHSGHARMALEAACMHVEAQPVEERERTWKRVMAGFILAEGLPTTPEPSNYHLSVQLSAMLHEKAKVSHQLHANSRVKVNIASESGEKQKQGIADWLHPRNFAEGETNFDFLRQLANMKPWVVKGHPEKSLLVKEIGWGGRMFGAFSVAECKVLEEWIRRLGSHVALPSSTSGAYAAFTGQLIMTQEPSPAPLSKLEDILANPSARRAAPRPAQQVSMDQVPEFSLPQDSLSAPLPSIQRFLALYFVSLGLLEQTIVIPSRLSNPIGMRIVQYLRAMHGFNADAEGADSAVSGMDEVTDIHPSFFDIGLALVRKHGLPEGESLHEMLSKWDLPETDRDMLAGWMRMSYHHVRKRDRLIGAALAAAKTVQSVKVLAKLGADAAHIEQADLLSGREQAALAAAMEDLNESQKREAQEGFAAFVADLRFISSGAEK